MDLKNKSDLEQYFAENFDTVFFPLLADIYRKENDLNRARKVCEIGLEYHPSNIPGAFILAEINQAQGNLAQAEKYFKNILNNCPWHYRALVNLVKIETKLNRSTETITKLWTRIVRINPTHTEARLYLKLPPVKEPRPLKITSIAPDIKKETKKKEAKVVEKTESQVHESVEKPKVDKKKEVKPAVKQPEEKTPVKTEKTKENKLSENETVKTKDEKVDKKVEADSAKAEEDKSDQKKIEEKTEDVPKQVDDEVEDLKKKISRAEEDSSEKDIFKEMAAKTEEIKTPKPPTIKQKKLDEEELQSLDITPRMATFTMVNVLKRQKLYHQALYVLNMLEEKGADKALIDQERQTIQELLDKSETE